MSADRIARMANDIARYMETRPPAEAAPGLAAHINDFWDPRMRQKLLDLIGNGAPGLRPLVTEAAPLIRPPPQETGAGAAESPAASSFLP